MRCSFVFVFSLCASLCPLRAAAGENVYVLAYFRTTAEALHLAYSEDGFKWTPLNENKAVLSASVGEGNIRDPFIAKGPDGGFHLLSTNDWNNNSIIYARSKDLIEWTDQRLLPVMQSVAGTKNAWAPEFVYDPGAKEYLIFWASVTDEPKHQRIWCCRRKDFKKLSNPRMLFDPGYTVIDATIVRNGNRWVMAYKDERGENKIGTDNKAMRIVTAQSLGGPYGNPSDLVTAHLTEGPIVFRAGTRWLMLYDRFLEGKWAASQSTDLIRWKPVGVLSVPPEARHGSVLRISREHLKRLQQAWPAK